MIELYNLSYIENDTQNQKQNNKQENKQQDKLKQKKYCLKIYQNNDHSRSYNNPQEDLVLKVDLFKSNNKKYKQSIYEQVSTTDASNLRIKIKQKNINNQQQTFTQCKYKFQLHSVNQNDMQFQLDEIQSTGELDLTDTTENHSTFTAFNHPKKQFVAGFLCCNYNIISKDGKLVNEKKELVDISLFSLKVRFRSLPKYKRAFITINKLDDDLVNNSLQDSQSSDSLSILKNPNIIKLPLKTIKKGWIWYDQVFQISFQLTKKNLNSHKVQIKLYSFDVVSGDRNQQASYKGLLYLDFKSKSDIKFVDYELENQQAGGQIVMGNVEFKYCQKNGTNDRKIKQITSKAYLQNAFSPASLSYDTSSFVPITSNNFQYSPNKNKSFIQHNTSSPLNKNSTILLSDRKNFNRNIFVKSRFHSVFNTNAGIAMNKQQRFKIYKQKLTDQSAYYGHKTLDINELPTRQKYKYASFGKDKKQCLKQQAFHIEGPGSARYRLPSMFDKYH